MADEPGLDESNNLESTVTRDVLFKTSKVTAYSSFLDVLDNSRSKAVMKDKNSRVFLFLLFYCSTAALLTNPSQPLLQLLLDRARKRPVHLFPQSLEKALQVKHV